MKTLDQIASTGIALNSTNTPGTDGYSFTITSPGSYYLTGNLNVTGSGGGIHVTVADVSIDLNSFVIRYTGSTQANGITIDTGAHRCRVKNGSIVSFLSGVSCSNSGPQGDTFSNLSATGCGYRGIESGSNWKLESCRAYSCGGMGISTGSGSTLNDCISDSTSGYGFVTGANCSLTHCLAANNSVGGFSASSGCNFTFCTASANSALSPSAGIASSGNSFIFGCTALSTRGSQPNSNNGIGILAGDNSIVKDCVASNNLGDGIQVTTICLITGNNCSSNGLGNNTGIGDGIQSTGPSNRFDGNHLTSNKGYGIHSSNTAGDVIVRNTSSGNGGAVSSSATANYSPSNGPTIGPLSLPGGSSTSPWANF